MAAAGPSVQADTTVEVIIPAQSGADYDILFPTVFDATDLVSFSSGTVNTGEFGTLDISAIDTDNVYHLLYSGSLYTGGSFGQIIPLINYTGNNFTPFPSKDIKGLHIESGGSPSATLSFTPNTVLTFAVPEPTATLLIFSALFLMAARRNALFRRPVADQ